MSLNRSITLIHWTIVCLYLASVTTFPLCAEKKVVERSSKSVPEWIARHPVDHLVVVAEGNTMQEAQQRAELELLRKVISAVAVNVEGKIVTQSSVGPDGESDTMHSGMKARLAQLPFVSDITLARCTDTYWQRSSDKSAGSIYELYALYPFDTATRTRMTDSYERYDAEMEETLRSLENDLPTLADYEGISSAEGKLEGLTEWFPDKPRRARAVNTLEQYRRIKENLSLVAEDAGSGKCHVMVLRGDNVFHVNGRLEVTSECASRITVRPDGDGWSVTYNDEDCLPDEDNTLQLSLRVPGLRLKAVYSF